MINLDTKTNLTRTIRQTAAHRGITLASEVAELFARQWLTVAVAFRLGYSDVAGRIATGELSPSDLAAAAQAVGIGGV